MKKTLATLLVCATVACSAFGLAACGDKHTHTPGEWINTDPTGHYKLCTDSKCDNPTEKLESAAHDTNGANGSCSVCGYAPQSQTPPETVTPEEALKSGFYAFEYTAGANGAMKRALRFYDDILYYVASGGGGTQHAVYNYKLEKKNYDYTVWYTALEAGRGADGLTPAEKHTGTADYTITVTDRSNSESSYSLGYDGTYIYVPGRDDTFLMYDTEYMRLTHDATKDAEYGDIEVGQPIVQLYKEDDETAYFTIMHDGTYTDLMDSMIEGTWTSAKAADGKVTYTLTPDDATDTGATVMVNADGKAGTYTPNGGTAVNVAVLKEKTALLTLTGNTTMQPAGVSNPIDAVLNLYLYGDFTCKLVITVAGNTSDVDSGTFGLNASYSYKFTFDTLGEIDSTATGLGTANAVYTVVIPADSATGRAEATLTNGTVAAPEVLFTFEGSAYSGVVTGTLKLFDDGTCSYELKQNGTAAGEPQTGTYTKNTYQIPTSITISGQTIEISWNTETGVFSANMATVSNNVPLTVTFTLPSQA